MFPKPQRLAISCRRLIRSGVVPVVALVITLLVLGAPASGQIAFNSASTTASTTAVSSLSWSHTLGNGTHSIVIFVLSCEITTATNANVTSVTFNGVAATSVPNSKIFGGGTGI